MPIRQVIEGGRVPVKVWTTDIEPEAVQQLKNTAALPFVFKHVSVMPDVHWGMGATVGSVVATKGAVCPAAVGVDIGCGMIAAKIKGLRGEQLGNLIHLRHSIERSIPVGFNENKTITEPVAAWSGWGEWDGLSQKHSLEKAQAQVGSLGGGNHFIEVCLDTAGEVWVVLHSGSRGIGNKLASGHIEGAKDLMRRMFIELPDPDLAYFAMGTPEFKAYMRDLLWAQDYALENREEMMRRVLKDLKHHLKLEVLEVEQKVNCHHNFAKMENHYGENVLVTRKGAVRAQAGDMGIIPGSMGTRSYIVRGLGNPESFNSCSHGAGRRMSRNKARKAFTREDLIAQTAGVECRKDAEVIDEIPGAYKPIEDVMAHQSDLVEIVAELKQVLCVKG
jgi:tRNA-splicing ligase RtcB